MQPFVRGVALELLQLVGGGELGDVQHSSIEGEEDVVAGEGPSAGDGFESYAGGWGVGGE